MHIVLLKITVCSLWIGINGDGVTFQNVSVKWNSKDGADLTPIVSSNSLKENAPNASDKLSATVHGLVPVLYENSVSDIDNLETLTMSGVDLEDIKPGAFVNLPGLKYLVLKNNKLKEIQTGTFRNLNVTSVNLDDNNISILHPGAFKDSQIHHMTLSNNKLSKIGENVFENVALVALNFYGNFLHNIEPKALAAIPGLASLVLSNNKFEEINPEAFDIPELTNLDVNFNSIKILRPGDFENLPKLTSLELVANKLEKIHEGVFNGTKLTHLSLNYNHIVDIAPQAFDNMPELSVLRIDHNNLTTWDNNWLHNTSQIAYVTAGFNQIEEIPDEAFRNYPRPYSIDLQANGIKTISPKAFDKLEHVVNFSLRQNKIDHWDTNLLDNANVTIGTLDLSDNKLSCIEGDLKKIFRKVDFVVLYDNQWRDDCENKVEMVTKSEN